MPSRSTAQKTLMNPVVEYWLSLRKGIGCRPPGRFPSTKKGDVTNPIRSTTVECSFRPSHESHPGDRKIGILHVRADDATALHEVRVDAAWKFPAVLPGVHELDGYRLVPGVDVRDDQSQGQGRESAEGVLESHGIDSCVVGVNG